MSMDRCTRCDKLVDTDYFPEFYREEFDHALICDSCIEAIEHETAVANDKDKQEQTR